MKNNIWLKHTYDNGLTLYYRYNKLFDDEYHKMNKVNNKLGIKNAT